MAAATPDWLNTHSHEPNPTTPSGDASFVLEVGGKQVTVALEGLQALPYTEHGGCFIVSTGHGVSGPFRFGGVLVADFLTQYLSADADVDHVDFVSADGYGTRLDAHMLGTAPGPLLAWRRDGALLHREQGLVRLIVPGEADDALHQVKWLARVEVGIAVLT